MTTTMGIDPGKSGAVAVIHHDGVISFHDTPTIEVTTKRRTKGGNQAVVRVYDERAMAEILRKSILHLGDTIVVIEEQRAFPDQHVVATFNQGLGYGLWLGICAGLSLPMLVVTPQRWKATMLAGFSDKDKAAAEVAARRLFPAAAADLRTPRGRLLDGRADALLIAEYGRRMSAPVDYDRAAAEAGEGR